MMTKMRAETQEELDRRELRQVLAARVGRPGGGPDVCGLSESIAGSAPGPANRFIAAKR